MTAPSAQARGFLGSLFDYSFSSYLTPRIIKVLYVLATILVALWTLLVVLVAFRASSSFGIFVLLIGGPIYFVIAMIWVRVGLEVLSAFFRVHADVQEINRRVAGAGDPAPASAPPPAEPAAESTVRTPAATASSAPEPAVPAATAARYCANCGAVGTPGKSFCTACGDAL